MRGEFSPSKEDGTFSVRDAADRFLDRKGLTASTKRSYRIVLNLLVESLIDRGLLLRELRKEDIEDFLDERNLTRASRASYARQVNAFLNWCVNEGHLGGDRKPVIPAPQSASQLGRKLFLTPGEYRRTRESVLADAEGLPEKQKVLNHLSWTVDVFDLAISTGLRLDELTHLQWQDVKLDRGVLEVRPKTLSRDGIEFMPKGKRARFIELQPLAFEVLERSSSGREDRLSRVLLGPFGPDGARPPMNANRAGKVWRKHRRIAEISDPVPLHGLRHMFVTYLLILGYETFYVQNWAGHASITTTEGYAQFARQLSSRRERDRLIGEIVSLGFARI